MATVFLSYRQENETHKARVRDFALRLRSVGVQVVLDMLQNEEIWNKGGPNEGWLQWSYRQVECNEKVLIIGSPGYYLVYEGKASEGVGVRAAIEARSIFQLLADAKGINSRFRVVTLAPGHDKGIPTQLKDYHRYAPNEKENDFDDLVTWLNAVAVRDDTPPRLKVDFPSERVAIARDTFLNCINLFDAFEEILTAGSKTRILLIEADGEHGKSTLLKQFYLHTRALLGSSAAARIEFKKPGLDPDGHLRALARTFNVTAPVGGNLDERTHHLFELVKSRPKVLFINAYEHAETTEALWVEHMLERAFEDPSLRCVLAGRRIPTHEVQPWTDCAHHSDCDAFKDPTAFVAYARSRGSALPEETISMLCKHMRQLRDRQREAGRQSEGISPKYLMDEILRDCPGGGARECN